jgi:hypothetical protein
MEVSGQLHAPVYPRYSVDRRLGESQSRSGRGDEEKITVTPTGNRTPVVQPVA